MQETTQSKPIAKRTHIQISRRTSINKMHEQTQTIPTENTLHPQVIEGEKGDLVLNMNTISRTINHRTISIK